MVYWIHLNKAVEKAMAKRKGIEGWRDIIKTGGQDEDSGTDTDRDKGTHIGKERQTEEELRRDPEGKRDISTQETG